MKKITTGFAVVALIAVTFAVQPAAAHEANIEIVGGQYLYYMPEIPPEGGTTGTIGTPAGPVEVGSIPSADAVQVITNRDALDHTFTECTDACDTADGSFEGARFDIAVAAGATASTVVLPAGALTFMCTIYPWMRGQINIAG